MNQNPNPGSQRRLFGWITLGLGVFFGGLFLGVTTLLGSFFGGADETDTPVRAKVVKLYQSGDGFTPEFEVVEGPHTGKRYLVRYSSTPPPHSEGDVVDAYLNEETGVIASHTMIEFIGSLFSILRIVGLAIGGILIAAGVILLVSGYRARRALAA